MKKTLLLITVLACNLAAAQTVISTRNTSLVLRAVEGEVPYLLHYGARLQENDLQNISSAGFGAVPLYPSHNDNTVDPEAVAVVQSDGSLSLDLRVQGVSVVPWEGGSTIDICCKDPVYPVSVHIFYKSYDSQDMIVTWTEICNTASGRKAGSILLTRFDSGTLPIRMGDVWTVTFDGEWADEANMICQPLKGGIHGVYNRDGVRNSQTSRAETMISLDGKPQELSGRVIGAALCYPGNYELRFATPMSDASRGASFHRFYAGIDPAHSNYTLGPGERFTTPELAFTWSAQGMSGVSRNFHEWGRKYRLAHGEEVNDILLNSWEGVYFDIKEEGMHQMMRDIKDLGGELFVMDDGWFGRKYPRNSDRQGLGDWMVDEAKLPHGIQGLVEEAGKVGVKFGIWIEPEMLNTTSELYEAHPDWVINAPNRANVTGRGGVQMVLDLSNPAVQDHVFKVFDDIMTANPQIAYVKWDANMSVVSQGSGYLGNQQHLYIEYHRGLARVLDRIRAKYPGVAIQACASGGGRANWGVLPWFDEFWTSDNTDALQRVYMQWSTSYFFPAEAMAAHISASPNHQTGREIPLKYRIDVAMSGRLGMEMQPSKMTAEEKDMCRRAIADYKIIRDIVQLGDIYRIHSPYDGDGLATLLYATGDKDRAAYFWWRTDYLKYHRVSAAVMAGLDPEKNYRVRELNRSGRPLPFEGKVFSGRFLMQNGLDIPADNTSAGPHLDFGSHVLYLTAE